MINDGINDNTDITSPFDAHQSESYPCQSVIGLKQAAETLLIIPEHEKLHKEVAQLTESEPQPLQPDILDINQEIAEALSKYVNPDKTHSLECHELTYLGGTLVQFSDYMPVLQQYAKTGYTHINNLYQEITELSEKSRHSLNFDEQLTVALHQTEGDLANALWMLFITSRQYARWLDSKSIDGIPDFCKEEKINRMIKWQKALAACKEDNPQDAPGDTYYTWTHALASLAYNVLPAQRNKRTKLASEAFVNGTWLMHKIIHRINPQAVINPHDRAANYGNSIGQTIVEFSLKNKIS
jgi:hypothetical protein